MQLSMRPPFNCMRPVGTPNHGFLRTLGNTSNGRWWLRLSWWLHLSVGVSITFLEVDSYFCNPEPSVDGCLMAFLVSNTCAHAPASTSQVISLDSSPLYFPSFQNLGALVFPHSGLHIIKMTLFLSPFLALQAFFRSPGKVRKRRQVGQQPPSNNSWGLFPLRRIGKIWRGETP